MGLRKFELSSNTLHNLINVGTYGTELDDVINVDCDDELFDYDNYITYLYNNSLFLDKLLETAKSVLPKNIEFEKLNIKFEYVNVYSPKYYNFKNDSLNIDVTLDLDKLYKIIYKYENEFDIFLKENYKSHPGFINFMPSNIDEFYSNDSDEDLNIASAINFILYKIDFEKIIPEDLANLMIENYTLFDYVTPEAMEKFNNDIKTLNNVVLDCVSKGKQFNDIDMEDLLDDLIVINNEYTIEQYLKNDIRHLYNENQYQIEFEY